MCGNFYEGWKPNPTETFPERVWSVLQPDFGYPNLKNAETYIRVAKEFATLSKYEGTKVGCVLVKNGNMISHGINGYPKNVDDRQVNFLDRSVRLELAIHAEENALLKLVETGQNPAGAVAYMTHYPCVKCAARLYSVGIRQVIMEEQDQDFMDRWIIPNAKIYENLHGMSFFVMENKV